ncbi:MAG: hypothetical protein ACRDOF_08490 [Gaiellaceae bacterium]
MLRSIRAVKLFTGVCLAALLIVLALDVNAGAKPPPGGGNGQGKGRAKVTLCHKGVTIRVGFPAVKAHLRHGDTTGPCGAPAPTPGTARLTLIKHVVNNNGGTRTAGDFTITINGVTATGGNTLAGSEAGVTKAITTFGAYSVTESSVSGYALTSASVGCAGTIAPGQERVCLLTNDDLPATLTVVKQVINDHGGTKTPADFTVTINGVAAIGGNSFAGSASGTMRTLSSVGAYSVTEVAVPGYALQSASAGCSGTIALGESKSCVLTNNDV